MRLMQLFPMIHPAYIHSVLTQCNNDFVRTIDTLLRTRQARMPPRKFPPPLQFYQKLPNGPAIPRFVPRMPVIKVNGFNGINATHMNPQMFRQFGNFRLQYPTILPKPPVRSAAQFAQKVDEVPVIKVERKGRCFLVSWYLRMDDFVTERLVTGQLVIGRLVI